MPLKDEEQKKGAYVRYSGPRGLFRKQECVCIDTDIYAQRQTDIGINIAMQL